MSNQYYKNVKSYLNNTSNPPNFAKSIRERIEEENKNIIANDLQQKVNAFNQRVYEKNYNNAKFDTLNADLKILGNNLNDLFTNKNYKTQEEMDIYSNDLSLAISRLTSARNVLDLADREKNKETVNSLNSQINNLKEALTAVQDLKHSFNSFGSKEEYDIVKSFGEKTPEQLQEEVKATRKLTRDIARKIAHWESKQVNNEQELQEKRDVINSLKTDLEKARKQEGSLETAVKNNWAYKGLAQKKVEELSKAGFWENMGFAVESGFDQFFSGMQYKGKKPDYITTSATGQAAGAVRENVVKKYGFWGGLAYDAVNTYSNMVIPMALSRVPVFGQALSTYFLSESARGNAYKEAIETKGMTKQQANTYATLVGGAEGALNYLIGGLGKMGGKLTKGALNNITKNINNGLAKFLIKWPGEFASESLEEGTQNLLAYAFENIAKGEPVNKWEDIDWEQASYEALLGGLMGGFLGGLDVAKETAQELNTLALKKIGKTVNNNIKTNPQLLEDLKSLDVDASIKKEIGNVVINDDVAATGKSILKIQSFILTETQSRLSSALQQVGINKVEAPIIAKQMIEALYRSSNVSTYTNEVSNQIAFFKSNPQISPIFNDLQNGEYGGNTIKTLSKLNYNAPKNAFKSSTQSNTQPIQENANMGEIEDGAILQEETAYETDNATNSPFTEPQLEQPYKSTSGGEVIDAFINSQADKKPSISKRTQNILKSIFKKMGIEIDFDYTGEGDGQIKGNKISISKYCKDPIRFVIKHEFFHYLTNSKDFKNFKTYLLNNSIVFENWLHEARENKIAYETLQDAIDDYGIRYDNLSRDGLIEEIMCDFFGDVVFVKESDIETDLTNTITEDFFTEFQQKDRKLFERFIDAIKRFFAQFKQSAYEKDMAYLENRIIRLKETVDKKQVENDETVKNYISQTETRKSLTVDSEGNTLTANENPTESEDIRYSKPRQANPDFANMTTSEISKAVNNGELSVEDAIKGVKDAQNEKINSLSKRINKLKTRLDAERGLSDEPMFYDSHLIKIARRLKNDYNSALKTDELVEALRDFYSFIYTSKNLTQEDINEQAGKIADDIISERRKAFERDDVQQELIDYIKNLDFKLSDTDIGELSYEYGSLGEFKKRFHKVFNKLNENTSNTIDNYWGEIVDRFASVAPSLINENVNEGDQMRNLIKAYEIARDGIADISLEDEYYKADMIDALTESIYEGYYDVGVRTPNIAKVEAALQRQKIRNQKTRERRDEIINRYQLAREKGIEGRAKTRLRNSLENKRNRMRSIFEHGTKQRNVKAELQPFINDVLKFSEKLFVEENAVNIQQELKTLAADYYSALKNTPYFEEFVYERLINEGNNFGEISQELEQGGIYKTNIYKLSKTQLDKLNKIFAMINKQVTNSNDLFRGSIRQNTQEAVTNIESEVGKTHREFKGWVNFAKALPLSTLTPETLVDSIGSPTLKKYFTLLVKGELESGKDSRKAKNKLDEITNKYDFNIKKEKLDKPNYEIKLSNDKTYKFTLNQLLSFYALSKRQQALQHILSKDGGIRITTTSKVVKELKNQDIVLTQDDVTKINNLLTNKQKKMVDELQSYLTSLGEKGNEVSRALWGVDIFNEDVYFPIVVVDPKIRDIEGQKTQKTVSKKIKNHSSTKETNENANGQILVGDFFDIWTSHCEQMAQFNNKVLPIENIERIMRELGANANKVLGSETTKYIEKLIDDYNGYSKQKHAADAILGKGISVYKGVRVGLSITSAAKQYGAIVRAMEFIKPKYFVGKPINVKKSWNELIEYSGAAVLKDKGGMDIGSNKSSYKWYVDKIAYRDVTGFMAEAMDKVGWATIWEAVKKEVASNNPSLEVNSQEFLDKCGERFDEIAFKTQVYDSVLKRSGLQRSDSDAMKSSVAFMGEPTTIYNSLIKAILKYKETHDVKHTVNAFSKSVISIFASQLVTAFSYGLIKSLMIQYDEDDEDKRSYLEDVLTISLQSFVDETNPLTMIPLVKDIVEYSRGYSNERMETASIGNLIKAINTWVTASEKGEADFDSFADTFISALELVGIPANNARNIGKALYGAVTKPFDEKKPVDIAGAIRQGVTGESKETRLYKAIINGDTEAVKEFERRYGDKTKFDNAVVKGLAENDKRIKKALKASKEGNIAEYNSIVSELISEGKFEVDTIFKAVNKVDVSKEKEETQYEEFDNFGNVSIPQNIQNEFAKIYISTGSLPTPSKASSKFMVDGEEITLTPEQYNQYAKSRGQKSVEYAEDVISNSYYNKLTDEEKLKAFSKVYSYATALAKTEVSEYELDGANETCYNLSSKNNVSIANYWIAKVLLSDNNADRNGDGKVTDSEKKKLLRDNGYTSSQASTIVKGNRK